MQIRDCSSSSSSSISSKIRNLTCWPQCYSGVYAAKAAVKNIEIKIDFVSEVKLSLHFRYLRHFSLSFTNNSRSPVFTQFCRLWWYRSISMTNFWDSTAVHINNLISHLLTNACRRRNIANIITPVW